MMKNHTIFLNVSDGYRTNISKYNHITLVFLVSLVRIGYTSLHHQTLHTLATYVFELQYTIKSFLKD